MIRPILIVFHLAFLVSLFDRYPDGPNIEEHSKQMAVDTRERAVGDPPELEPTGAHDLIDVFANAPALMMSMIGVLNITRMAWNLDDSQVNLT